MVMGECISASKCWSLLRGGLSQEGSLNRGTTALKSPLKLVYIYLQIIVVLKYVYPCRENIPHSGKFS